MYTAGRAAVWGKRVAAIRQPNNGILIKRVSLFLTLQLNRRSSDQKNKTKQNKTIQYYVHFCYVLYGCNKHWNPACNINKGPFKNQHFQIPIWPGIS